MKKWCFTAFGSAARGADFEAHSDADFLVTFARAARNDLAAFADFKDELEALLGRRDDLVDGEAVEASRTISGAAASFQKQKAVYG